MKDLPWKIYQLNDCEWWLARTLEEAKARAAMAEEQFDSDAAHELTDAELDQLHYLLGEGGNLWECDCGLVTEHGSARCMAEDMRWNGRAWEHRHAYPMGHVEMRNWITFREELNRRIKAGAKVELFATTEF